ncbi:hypothetical protein ABGT15_13005 [Flavobacterium enshiense]|uniref:hypothetical protein n=1 Tax=Flavobacterium enshiense TaxID=1341165 RepID=UPI00345D57A4
MIIGNKDVFALEFYKNENNPKMGYGKLWIQNMFLGTKEDLIFLNGYLIGLLDEIINSQSIEINIIEKDKEEIFDLIKSTNEKRSEYIVLGSTFTDDFEIYSFEKENQIFLLWKLRNDIEIIFDELKNYSKEIHFVQVSKNEVQNVKEKLLTEII